MEDLSDEFFTENSSINVEFLNNRAGEKSLLIINNCILGLLWGTQWVFYLTLIENVKLQKFQP